MLFNMPVVFAQFEADLLGIRTREGMAAARARGKLKGRQPKLSARQQAEPVRMHATGDYTIAELMKVFSVGRPTVCRALERIGILAWPAWATTCQGSRVHVPNACLDTTPPERVLRLDHLQLHEPRQQRRTPGAC
ncbi:hypothetical protein OOK13_40745 [Streptomyces sp. NBC_00378]|uniref:hypothetical protein n=1 Tax=Streptomyces sp. NBC_00378 TaxID=2975732 RepID=UPI0022563B99|nr:hypothetical protein [Streptomyces sp. NBC_00378]MCX5114688.1 hypothetical protein [Streptomyces sp. NBC_00378]